MRNELHREMILLHKMIHCKYYEIPLKVIVNRDNIEFRFSPHLRYTKAEINFIRFISSKKIYNENKFSYTFELLIVIRKMLKRCIC